MHLMNSKRAAAFTWIAALVIIFGLGLLYITMTPAFDGVYDAVYPLVDSEYQVVFTQLRSVWYIWPLILIGGIIIWAVMRSMRRDPNEYYYG